MGQILNLLLGDNVEELKVKRAKLERDLELINEAIKELEK